MGRISTRAKGVGCVLCAGFISGLSIWWGSSDHTQTDVSADAALVSMTANNTTLHNMMDRVLRNDGHEADGQRLVQDANVQQFRAHESYFQDQRGSSLTTRANFEESASDFVPVEPEFEPIYSAIAKLVAKKQAQPSMPLYVKADNVLRSLADLQMPAKMKEALVQQHVAHFDAEGRVGVTLTLKSLKNNDVSALRDRGFRIIRRHVPSRKVEGFIAPSLLATLSDLPNITALSATHSAFVSSQGSASTQGDVLLSASQARITYGVSGERVKICVISDGISGAAQAALAGELPQNPDGSPAIDLCSVNAADNYRGAEGTAMLEIIHDIAPGADLGFCGGQGSEVGMLNAIDYLSASTGGACDIIVDDLDFLAQPYFQEGDIALAVKTAIQSGVTFVSAAGNAGGVSGTVHYESELNPTFTKLIPGALGHIFYTSNRRRPMPLWPGSLQPGGVAVIVLQWGEPFGQSQHDLDLYIVDRRLNVIDLNESRGLIGFNGTTQQMGLQKPLEIAVVQNISDQVQNFYVVLQDIQGVGGARPLEMFVTGDQVSMAETAITREGSIVGHSALNEVITVGAINATTPDLAQIAPYSGQGPARFLFSYDGLALAPSHYRALVQKPNLVAVDAVSVSGAGGFSTQFFGTSAAAPHVAAIAGLALEANPDLTPRALKSILTQTADPRGAERAENVYGAGIINAQTALGLAVASRLDGAE